MRQIAWTLDDDWRKDLSADFFHIYNIQFDPFDEYDFGGLTLPHYISLCYRITAYDGLVSAKFQAQAEEEKRKKAIEDGNYASLSRDDKNVAKMSAADYIKNRKAAVKKETDPIKQSLKEANETSAIGSNLVDFN